jgi:nucleoside-diphosphate-sugar epimerase
MKILVTGSASHLAQALLPRLLAHPAVTKVVGLDWRINPLRHPRYRHVLMDMRAAEIEKIMRGMDAVIHLGFVVLQRDLGERRHDRAWMRDINVNGSANVFACAARAGVPRLIHCSSAAVYDLATPYKGAIPESHPRRALAGFDYAEDQVAVEDRLDTFEIEHPETQVIRLRPQTIVGPHAQPFVNQLLASRFYPKLSDPQPLRQCVHEDDVVQAIELALTTAARGAFNLAPADSLSFKDSRPLLHRSPLALSLVTIRTLLSLGWKFFRLGTAPSWLPCLHYNLVLHSRRARKELGWQPRYDSVRDCLLSIKPGR